MPEKQLRKQNSKTRPDHGVVNGSIRIGFQDGANELTSMIMTETNLPRSETIGAICHRSFTDNLSSMEEDGDPDEKKTSNEGNQDFCSKCGHCIKKEEN